MLDFLQYTGAGLAMTGAILVARHTPASKYGFVLYLFSSFFLIAWSYFVEAWGMLGLNAFYCVLNIYGIYRWFSPSVKHNL